MGFELPKPESRELDSESIDLTSEEIRILKKQIRNNTILIDQHVSRLDLFVNKEQYPRQAVFLEKIRKRLDLLMEENDTFREVLWQHFQRQDFLGKAKKVEL